MGQGSVVKCIAVYDEPFWRADGLSGQVTSADGPVKVMFDNSPPDGKPGVLLGVLAGRQARELGSWDADARRTAVVGCFARLFGPRAANPVQYLEQVWAEEEYTRGCYGCIMPPGGWVSFGQALRPVGRVRVQERAVGPLGAVGERSVLRPARVTVSALKKPVSTQVPS